MSDTEGMVRVMEHASDQLRKAIAQQRWLAENTHMGKNDILVAEQTVAALAFGEATLRVVAAALAPEVATVAAKVRAYEEWAERTDDAAPLGRAEIESVVRYLVGES